MEDESLRRATVRIWQGKVPEAKADEYVKYMLETGIKKIQTTTGNLGVQVLRRTEQGITEFTTISYWESREAIHRFAGDDIEKPNHLPKDLEYLIELPQQVLHYELEYSDIAKVSQGDLESQR